MLVTNRPQNPPVARDQSRLELCVASLDTIECPGRSPKIPFVLHSGMPLDIVAVQDKTGAQVALSKTPARLLYLNVTLSVRIVSQ